MRHALVHPDADVLVQGRWKMNRREFDVATRRVASTLIAQGIAPGDTVGIAMGNSPRHLILMLALARMGAISVSIHPAAPMLARQELVEHFKPVALITQDPGHAVDGCPLILIDPSWTTRRRPEHDLPAHDAPGACWRVHLSSGTTGTPKGILRSHWSTLNLGLLQQNLTAARANARFVCSMDLNTGAFVSRILCHLFAGGVIVFPVSASSVHIFEAIRDHGVTHVFTVPSAIGRWLREVPGDQLRCPAIEHLAIGGGLLRQSLAQEVAKKINPAVFVTFGTSETGLLAGTFDSETHRRHPGTVGHVVAWAQAQAVDEQDRPLAAGEAGILRFRGIGFADSYHENPAATARTFRNGWIYPGDTGTITHEGLIYIGSRTDDKLNVGGAKFDPVMIENALSAHAAVIEAVAFNMTSDGHRELLCAAVVTRAPVDENTLRLHCEKNLGPYAPQRIFMVPELPRNSLGKIVRHKLAEHFAISRKNARPQAGA